MQMSMRALVMLPLLVAAACAGFPFWRAASPHREGQSAKPAQVETELQNSRFDGYDLRGRYMIGVVEGSVRLDKRLVEEVSINLDSVNDCASGLPISALIADRFPPPPTDEDLLVLERGYWYGADVYFPLFMERPGSQPGPECIEVALSLRSFEGQVLAHTQAQVRRELRASPEPDAGMRLP